MTARPSFPEAGSVSATTLAVRRRILRYLVEHPGPVPHAELRHALGYGNVTVGLRCRELVRDGLVRGNGKVGWEAVG